MVLKIYISIKCSVVFCYFTQPFHHKQFQGKFLCSSVKMQKGYMVRERLGTTALDIPI